MSTVPLKCLACGTAPPPVRCTQRSLADYYGRGDREDPVPGVGAAGASARPGEARSPAGQALVLTRVLDLPLPVICAFGPLVAHLQVRSRLPSSRGVPAALSLLHVAVRERGRDIFRPSPPPRDARSFP